MKKFFLVFLAYFLYSSLCFSQEEKAISFMNVEKTPIYPECNGEEEELRKCFNKQTQRYFARNFDSFEAGRLMKKEKEPVKVFIGFTLGKDGKIKDIKVNRSPNEKIKELIIKTMKDYPKVTPGYHNGKVVEVKYIMPFTMNFSNKKSKKPSIYDIKEVDKVPVFDKCNSDIDCFFKELDSFIQENLNTHIREKKLPGKKYKMKLYFQIGSKGSIENIIVKTSITILEKEITRILKLLPNKFPAVKDDRFVRTFAFKDYTLRN